MEATDNQSTSSGEESSIGAGQNFPNTRNNNNSSLAEFPDAEDLAEDDATSRASPRTTSRHQDQESDSDTSAPLSDEGRIVSLISETRLEVDGYLYAKHEKLLKTIKWVCIRHRSQQCQAKISPDLETKQLAARPKTEARVSSATNAVSIESSARERLGYLDHPVLYRKFLLKFLEKPEFKRKYIIRALKVIYTSLNGCIVAFGRVLEYRKKISRDLELLRNNPNAEITGLKSKSNTEIPQKMTKRKSTRTQSETQQSSSRVKLQHLIGAEDEELDPSQQSAEHKLANSSEHGKRNSSDSNSRRDADRNSSSVRGHEKKVELSTHSVMTVPRKNEPHIGEKADNEPYKGSSSNFQQKVRLIKVGNTYEVASNVSRKIIDSVDKNRQDDNDESERISNNSDKYCNRSTSRSMPHQATQGQSYERNPNPQDLKQRIPPNSADKTAVSREGQPNSTSRVHSNKMDDYVPMKILDRSKNESISDRDGPRNSNHFRQNHGQVQEGQNYNRVPWNGDFDKRNQYHPCKNQNHFDSRRFDNSRNDSKRQSHSYPFERSNNREHCPKLFNTFNRFCDDDDDRTRNRPFQRRGGGRSYSRWDVKPYWSYSDRISSSNDVNCSDQTAASYNQPRTFARQGGFNNVQENDFNNFRGDSPFNSGYTDGSCSYYPSFKSLRNDMRKSQAQATPARRPINYGQIQDNHGTNIHQCETASRQMSDFPLQQTGYLNEPKENFERSASSVLTTKSLEGERTVSSESVYMSESQNLQNISDVNNTSREMLFPAFIENVDGLDANFNDFDIPTLQSLELPPHDVERKMKSSRNPDHNSHQPRPILCTSSPHPTSGNNVSNAYLDQSFGVAHSYRTQEFHDQRQGVPSRTLVTYAHNTQNLNSLASNPDEVEVLRNRVERLEKELLDILRQDLKLAEAELSAAEAKLPQTSANNAFSPNPNEMSQRSTVFNQPAAASRAISHSMTAGFATASSLSSNVENDQIISTASSELISETSKLYGQVSNQQLI